jgi:hypothetical protein
LAVLGAVFLFVYGNRVVYPTVTIALKYFLLCILGIKTPKITMRQKPKLPGKVNFQVKERFHVWRPFYIEIRIQGGVVYLNWLKCPIFSY